MLLIVATDGEVQNRVLVTDRAYTASQLAEAANAINQHYAGLDLGSIASRVRNRLLDLHRDISSLMQAAIETGGEALRAPADGVVLSGERNLLDVEDLASDRARLRKLFDLFERKAQLLGLLDQSDRAEGVKIFIGGDSQLVPLDECSISSPRPTRWTARWSARWA